MLSIRHGKQFTALYLILTIPCIALMRWYGVIERIEFSSLNEVGDFMAGYFSPLAFLWLIIGYFQQSEALKVQQEELKNNIEVLRLQHEEMRNSVEQQSRQANALKRQILADIEKRELDKRNHIAENYPYFIVKMIKLHKFDEPVFRPLRGGKSLHFSEGLNYELELKNIGKPAFDVSQEKSDIYGVKQIYRSTYIEEGETFLEALSIGNPDENRTARLTIISHNARKERQTQVFTVQNGAIVEAECNPPRT